MICTGIDTPRALMLMKHLVYDPVHEVEVLAAVDMLVHDVDGLGYDRWLPTSSSPRHVTGMHSGSV